VRSRLVGQGPPECLAQWTGQEAVIEGADRVVALTRSEHDLVGLYCPRAEGRVRIVGNGIEDATAAAHRARSKGPDPPVVLFSGRFVERKGIRELIEAITLVLAELRVGRQQPRPRDPLADGQ
jgi:glycosyltransferase involved in cell wall biosynthesis